MFPDYKDRVKEATTTSGTGSYALGGAPTSYQGFVAAYGDGASIEYCITSGSNFEIGQGTVTDGSPDTISRDVIIASSNGGAAVNWGSESKEIFSTVSGVSLNRLNVPAAIKLRPGLINTQYDIGAYDVATGAPALLVTGVYAYIVYVPITQRVTLDKIGFVLAAVTSGGAWAAVCDVRDGLPHRVLASGTTGISLASGTTGISVGYNEIDIDIAIRPQWVAIVIGAEGTFQIDTCPSSEQSRLHGMDISIFTYGNYQRLRYNNFNFYAPPTVLDPADFEIQSGSTQHVHPLMGVLVA